MSDGRLAMLNRLLADIDRLLLSSLDHETVMYELARALVPGFADHCVIRLVVDGEWGRIALAYPEASTSDFADQLQRRFPVDQVAEGGGIHRVLRDGEPILFSEIETEVLEASTGDREYITLLHELGIVSAVFAPLSVRGHLRGSLGLFSSGSGRRYTESDLSFVKDLAIRLALSIENARLYNVVGKELEERRRTEAALRESEARFRVMADMAPVLIWMSDLEGRYHFFNKPWLEFTGRSSAEEAGEGWLEGMHPADREEYLAAYQSAFERHEPMMREYRLRRHDGEYRWILDHGVPRFRADGEFAGFIGSCIDISPLIEKRRLLIENAVHLEELTAELEHTIEELEARREEADAARAVADEANQAKSKFLAVMSHELRTPLNAIIGYSDLLDAEVTGTLNSDQHLQVQRIQQSSLHLLEMINKLLRFSRIEAGQETLEPEKIDLTQLAHDTIALIEPEVAGRGLELRTEFPPKAIVALTDPGKIRQILLNLLSNAVKFTDEGWVEFRMVEVVDGVVIEVRDTGIGIPLSERDRIFEAFAQVDQTTTRKRGGTGLGLSVSRELAQILGGRIEVDSAPGGGSIFRLVLPLDLHIGSIAG